MDFLTLLDLMIWYLSAFLQSSELVQVTALSKPAQLDALLARCGGSAGAKGTTKGAAAWGACVLLFTDKAATPVLYKSLAAQYAGKLVRGVPLQVLRVDGQSLTLRSPALRV